MGPRASSTQTAMGRPSKRCLSLAAQASMATGSCSMTANSGVMLAGFEQADVVLAVSPVEADDGGEVGRMAWHGGTSV